MNKTMARITSDVYQSDLRAGDVGYIDGYVQAADERPYAVFVRLLDGVIDFVSVNQIRATPSNQGGEQ